ncbi:DEAD-box type RNA helicase [Dinochytrium kinnereticum]|nr:DEAD-box type RNA helicase [Dinochytrium kinnereticum]
MLNANVSTDTIESFRRRILADGECFIHNNPDSLIEVSILWISDWSLVDSDTLAAASLLDDNLKCADCLLEKEYQEFKDRLKLSASQFHHDLWKKLNARDVKRHTKVFNSLLAYIETSDTFETHHKNLFLISASEVLRRPDSLTDKGVDSLFIRVLTSIQRKKPLRLKTGLLPGLLLLAVHKEADARVWAIKCISSSYATHPTGAEELEQLTEYVSILVNLVFDRSKSVLSYNVTDDELSLWTGLTCVINALTGDALELFRRIFPSIEEKLFNRTLVSNEEVFWRVLQCFCKFCGNGKSWLEDQDVAAKALHAIFKHEDFSTLSSRDKLGFTSEINDIEGEDKTEFCFKWILVAIRSLKAKAEDSVFLDLLMKYSGNLCQEAKEVFMNDVTIPLLTEVCAGSANVDFLQTVVIMNLRISATLETPEFSATQNVLDLIESDFSKMENAYEAFYNSKGHSTSKPDILLELWAFLAKPIKLPGSLSTGILTRFSRLYLLDHLSLPSVDVVPQDIAFNESLQTILQAIACILASADPSVFGRIGPTILYCVASPHESISNSGRKLISSITSTEKLTDALSHLLFVDVDFWAVYSGLLDSFRDYCTLGPPLLKSAIKILDMLLALFDDIFSDSSQEFDKETVWLKVWPFITAVLTSSVTWAKQDLKLKHFVTQTIERTFKLSAIVMNHFISIFPSPKFLKAVSVPFSNAIDAGAKWFRVHSESLRNQTVSVLVSMIQIAVSHSLRLEPTIIESLASYTSGVLKSHLSSSQKHMIELLLQRYKSSTSTRLLLGQDKTLARHAEGKISSKLEIPVKASRSDKLEMDEKTLNSTVKIKPQESVIATKSEKSSAIFKPAMPIISDFIKRDVEPPNVSVVPPPKRNLGVLFKPVKKPKKLSKSAGLMAQLRQEHYSEVRRTTAQKKTSVPRALSSDDDEPVSLKVLAADVSPNRPKRSIMVLDECQNVIDVSRKKKGAPAEPKTEKVVIRSLDDLRKIVLGWDLKSTGELPPNFNKEMRKIPAFFSSVNEYIDIFEPFAILEAWESFKTAKEETNLSNRCVMVVVSTMQVDNFFDVSFTISRDDYRRNRFSEYDMFQLEPERPKASFTPLLGETRSITSKRDDTTIVVRLYMKGRQQHQHLFHSRSKWLASRLFSLTTTIREYTALIRLSSIELKDDVVNPRYEVTSNLSSKEDIVQRTMSIFELNEPQAVAVIRAKEQASGFVLIQGPPGTGKTKTIVGLVGALITTLAKSITVPGGKPANKKNRILICAPSNAACDEILRRLRSGVRSVRGEVIVPKIVRLGTNESMSAEARELTLDNLAAVALKDDPTFSKISTQMNSGDWDALLAEQQNLIKERNELRKKEVEAKDSPADLMEIGKDIREATMKLKDVDKKIKDHKTGRSENTANMEKLKTSIRIKLIQEADIIISTLSGAGHDILSAKTDIEFPIVIIDEAGQAVELSSLIPLKYKAKKCILVGGIFRQSLRYGYEQSLFQRLMGVKSDRVSLLRAEWHKDPMFPPYAFLNVEWGREQRAQGHSLHNPDEVLVCFNLVCLLCTRFPDIGFRAKIGSWRYSFFITKIIAVITPYKLQMSKLRDKFKRAFGDQILQSIDINTVDAFQGQEKDIIIVSTVRAGLGKKLD